MHENQGDPPVHQPLIEPDVGVGEPRLGALHQHAVQMLHLQQGQQDLSFVGELVPGGKEQGGAVVLRADGLDLPQDAGKDVVADISRDHGDGESAAGRRLLPLPDMGAAALPPVDQPLCLQKGEGLPHRLPADLILGAERLFRGQGPGILSLQDAGPQRVGDHLILWIHGDTSVLSFLALFPSFPIGILCRNRSSFNINLF